MPRLTPRSTAVLIAAAAALLAPAGAAAEIRNGSSGAGLKEPADPDVRIKRAFMSYDTSGVLSGTVTSAGALQDKDVTVVFSAGTYTRKRVCKGLPSEPHGAVGGVTGTFSYPPVFNPSLPVPAATRLAFYDGASLGPDGVTYSAAGPSATVTGTVGLFANRRWNCGWVTLTDNALGNVPHDQTADFPLGRKAIATNKRLLRKQLKRCGRKRSAAKRSACRAKAREFYGVKL
jgi:hypothetical protein